LGGALTLQLFMENLHASRIKKILKKAGLKKLGEKRL
jgi:hypothetical protein